MYRTCRPHVVSWRRRAEQRRRTYGISSIWCDLVALQPRNVRASKGALWHLGESGEVNALLGDAGSFAEDAPARGSGAHLVAEGGEEGASGGFREDGDHVCEGGERCAEMVTHRTDHGGWDR